jgi:RNA polymerase sigma factor (sigma-70 family)
MDSDARQGGPGEPTRAQRERAALELISRRGPEVMRAARRFALDHDDAEDAYQRALEILLTKAPTVEQDRLLGWLKAVVKHEAFALRRRRDTPVEQEVFERPDPAAGVEDRAERFDRLRVGAEAMRRLKPQEARALSLRAEGLSYQEICEATSWTYTKVDRCLKEGRRSFLRHLEAIESGAECERLRPLLSRLADGEASVTELVAARPHVRACAACRAVLREYRAAPARVAALAPPAVVAGTGGDGVVARFVETVTSFGGERAGAFALKAQAFGELVSAQKLAAVAASTAVLAGGGAVAVERAREPAVRGADRQERVASLDNSIREGDAAPAGAVVRDPVRIPAAPSGWSAWRLREFAKPAEPGREFRARDAGASSGGGEFAASPEVRASPEAAAPAASRPAGSGEFAGSGGGSDGGASGGGSEFGGAGAGEFSP